MLGGNLGSLLYGDVSVMVACVRCQSFSDVSPYVYSHYISSVSVAEWPPFGNKLLIR